MPAKQPLSLDLVPQAPSLSVRDSDPVYASVMRKKAPARKARPMTQGEYLNQTRPDESAAPGSRLDAMYSALDRGGMDVAPLQTADKYLLGVGSGSQAVHRLLQGRGNGWDVLDAATAAPVAGPLGELASLAVKPALTAAGRMAANVLPEAVTKGAQSAGRSVKDYLTHVAPMPSSDYVDAAFQPAGRPSYTRATEGPFTVVRRSDLQPETNPDVLSARTLDQVRAATATPETNPALRLANAKAQDARGIQLSPNEPMPQTSLARQGGIARAFQEALSDNPAYKQAVFERYGQIFPEMVERSGAQNYDQLTEAAYNQLGKEVTQQFDQLPISMRYHEGQGEYGTPSEMIRDAIGRGQLNVFSGGDPHEFLSKIDPATGLSQNEMFRAVHDYIGHAAPGSTFRPGGEEAAYATHARTLSPLAQLALAAETRGQNSLVNYSPLNADLIAKINDARAQLLERQIANRKGLTGIDLPSTEEIQAQLRELGSRYEFAPQRAVLLPPEHLDPLSPGGTPDYLRSVYSPQGTSARGVHISTQPGLEATDPSFFGTGHQGAEYRSTKGVLPDRTYFYTGEAGSIRPEQSVLGMVGDMMRRGPRYAYEAPLSGLYDWDSDPEGLVKLARAYNLPQRESVLPEYLQYASPGGPYLKALGGNSSTPDIERLVRDYGYSGYLAPGGRAAALYDPVSGLSPLAGGQDLRDLYSAGNAPKFASGGQVKGDCGCGGMAVKGS